MRLLTKAVTGALKAVQAGPVGAFEGYASVFNNADEQGDVVKAGAFKRSLETWHAKGAWPKMLWQHDAREVIGVWTDMYEDEQGLYVKGQLLLEVAKAREARALLMAGAIDSMSIGYKVAGEKPGALNGQQVSYLTDIDLHEVSLVTFPANGAAKVRATKELCLDGALEVKSVPPSEANLCHIISEIKALGAYISSQ
jgi:hypothetical protein